MTKKKLMSGRRLKLLICLGLMCVSTLLSRAQPARTEASRTGRYQTIEVHKLEVAPDVDIPSNQINVIFLEIVDELHKIKKFDRVTKGGSQTASDVVPKAQPGLRLTGTISKYYAFCASEIYDRVRRNMDAG